MYFVCTSAASGVCKLEVMYVQYIIFKAIGQLVLFLAGVSGTQYDVRVSSSDYPCVGV